MTSVSYTNIIYDPRLCRVLTLGVYQGSLRIRKVCVHILTG